MKYYLEVNLLPNEEIPIHFLWSKAFQQIHLGIVEMLDNWKQNAIGLSFPGYVANSQCISLYSKLRLFAPDEDTLVRLDTLKWLSRLSDYADCTGILPVPDNVKGYAVYRRHRTKTNPERLARRYASRHYMDLETALNTTVELKAPLGDASYPTVFRYSDMDIPSVALPFIRLQSLSGGQTFCLWIAKTAAAAPVSGSFSTYGLSSVATVPEF